MPLRGAARRGAAPNTHEQLRLPLLRARVERTPAADV
jgi:hypothetical protein